MNDLWIHRTHAWLQSHAGIISIAKLAEFGCSRRQAYRLVERHEFEIVMPSILRSMNWPMGPEQLMVAACARSARAIIAFTTAARLWKFRGVPADTEVHALLPHGVSAVLPGVTIHHCRRIDDVDIVRRADGVRVTSPPRTLFDCADILGRDRTASCLEQLLDGGGTTFVTHVDTATRLAASNRPGARTMRTVISSRPAWRTAVQSELERLVLVALAAHAVAAPVVQHRVVLSDASIIRFDFAWPDVLVALEVDHPFWHAGSAESARDKRRDRSTAALGWQTIRITDLDIASGLDATVADIARIITLRRAQFRTAGGR
jgi:very-short-patch-repair endonuclease